MPKIYFIIVTYNAMKWAERCFSSLRKSSTPLQVIVVDNGSTDGTQEFIKSNFPEVKLIQSPENLGFGKANNLGIELAYKNGADFFYLMNQDAWIYEDTVQKLINFYENYHNKVEIGILSPIHLDGSEKKLEIFVEKYLGTNAVKDRIFTDLLLNRNRKYFELDFINAAHWFLPKDTVEKVGGFNPYFFHYGEDNEYVNRLRFKEKKTFLIKDCFAVHDGKQELGKVDYSRYTDTSIDTNILDPNHHFTPEEFAKSLKKAILKNALTGNFQQAKNQRTALKRIQSNSNELKKLKKILSTSPHPFLNL